MTAYAIGHLHNVKLGPDIVAYLERIDATLKPYKGRFMIHGGHAEILEGQWSGDLIAIAFPDRAAARAWYVSRDYQAIIGLRTRNACGAVIIIDGVLRDHQATDVLAPS